MNTITYHCGDVRDVMATLADGSVHLVVTSPPFLALRSYLPADHPDKHREIGSEATPAGFLDTMLGLTADWRRLLAEWGSIAVEIGDTYAGGNGFDIPDPKAPHRNAHSGLVRGRKPKGGAWPQAKSLCGIPTLYTWSLAYGRNLLTGEPSPAGSWRVRNLLTWTRPNPPVGALGDKFRPATSFVTVACTSARRWFDLDAVRTEHKDPTDERFTRNGIGRGNHSRADEGNITAPQNPAGAPPLDWWDDNWQPLHNLPTAPYTGSHYATFPIALPQRLIEAMCPSSVCSVCGEPRRRIAVTTNAVAAVAPRRHEQQRRANSDDTNAWMALTGSTCTERTTLGWTDCGHDNYTPGLVLDPFGGSGTTAIAAARTGRDAILIDLDHRNVALARQRIGEQLRIVTEHTDANTTTWTVEPPLPNQRNQIEGQTNLFDLLDQ